MNQAAELEKLITNSDKKVVIIDDDPTGSQTISNLTVLTEWSIAALARELTEPGPGFFILTNSRSMPGEEAAAVNKEIGENLARASLMTGKDFIVISRSDSTLRGHYPAETEALKTALRNTLDYDFKCDVLIPFFEEGGRYTKDDVHWIVKQGKWVPVSETEFAKDPVFGYKSSNLREWVSEKAGWLKPSAVRSISLDDLRYGGPERVYKILTQDISTPIIVNAVTYKDLEIFTIGAMRAESSGYRFMYRTASSFVAVRTGAASKNLMGRGEIYKNIPKDRYGGLVIAGSYVNLTTRQLSKALELEWLKGIEVNVYKLLEPLDYEDYICQISQMVEDTIKTGNTAVIYTTREYIKGGPAANSLKLGEEISRGLVEIAKRIRANLSFVLAKGGITSHTIATQAFNITKARVRGQVYPGISVWEPFPPSSLQGIPYIVFPGNVGDENTLKEVLEILGGANESSNL
ncbi:Protein of unknown function, DUF1537 [Moorella glycerini]|uniref:Hydroxyacid dehydrogenase n=1 Tax=Neomoorella stamsii TaxID=1266720 RepID=A0A9X7P707_9FIRM|nr:MULTISPECIES: four-carbon acid sugar kinase family protein [Moorella]PRR75650.1 hypothetical protein MOST_08330 [Moorella stamsii]CEP66506.1 Protein of unknown function, DUF1537 [Moorella glycerini]